jgi:hypothetical protein
MAYLNKDQLQIIATICSKLKLSKEDKATIVNGFSAGRCTSSKLLYFDEAKDCIAHLQKLQGGESKIKPGTEKMIGKMLAYARAMGWTKLNAENKVIADFARMDAWAVKFGYMHKKINDYYYYELPKLVSQFEAVYYIFLNKH